MTEKERATAINNIDKLLAGYNKLGEVDLETQRLKQKYLTYRHKREGYN